MINDQSWAQTPPPRTILGVSLAMSYIAIKAIKERQYRYQQRSYRQGRKSRIKSTCLGPMNGGSRRKGILHTIGSSIAANFKRTGIGHR